MAILYHLKNAGKSLLGSLSLKCTSILNLENLLDHFIFF